MSAYSESRKMYHPLMNSIFNRYGISGACSDVLCPALERRGLKDPNKIIEMAVNEGTLRDICGVYRLAW